MRRRFYATEEDLATEPHPLLGLTTTLLPLRQQRLSRLERSQQRASQALQQHQVLIDQQQQRLAQIQCDYYHCRTAMRELTRTSLHQLKSCSYRERELAQCVMQQQQHLERLEQQRQQLQSQLQQAEEQLAHQRIAVEKLNELRKLAEGGYG
jgi:exonuclease VII large subunit